MNITQIEKNLKKLISNFSKDTFIYDLLLAYNLPKATITRLKKGSANLSKIEGEVSLKKKLFFKEVYDEDLHLSITNIAKGIKHNQRFIIVTDYKTLLAKDTKINTTLDIPLKDLPKNYDFFLPWAGMEKAQYQEENPADIKAAVKMAKLFDEIKSDNNDDSPEFLHRLNIFLSRLLFCFFAEDTDIFKDNQFTKGIASHTQADGSDLNKYLDKLFEVLNIPEKGRPDLPEYLNDFPYVNGGLFAEHYDAPIFSSVSRKALIESGNQDWSAINPDIFGSMFQAVISVDQRGTLGQHYTSVPNIMKVIEPLFLNDLREEFESARGNEKKLNQLLHRLKNIKIFDPACGSGNFLIIAYKELRRLEMEIFKELGSFALSEISLSQFYGIELDDFAHEIAILALWLTKHQMNVEFFKEFGRTNPTLPLTDAGYIVQGNACRLDWEEVCPKKQNDEVYILGNPPYLGFSQQNKEQKIDIIKSFGIKLKIDYIGCWFIKAAKYLEGTDYKFAFVTTNSICQGEQVILLWPLIYELNLDIYFAHQAFYWSNNAKSRAAVICAIIGITNKSSKLKKIIFNNNVRREVGNITAYLTSGKNILIKRLSSPLSDLPKMSLGNSPFDGGNLILSHEDKTNLLRNYPDLLQLIRPLTGAAEFMKNDNRWVIWINDDQLQFAKSFVPIEDRISKTYEMRINSIDKGTQRMAVRAHQFRDRKEALNHSILVPRVGSSRREYLPCGFLSKEFIIGDSAQVIYDSETYLFGVLSSQLHLCWVRAVSGYLKMDFRYSSVLSYNTFPFPTISKQRKEELTQCTLNIIDERLKHSEKTLAQLYDPDKMPEGLREAHHQNDLAVERCYRITPFSSDEERLEYLFKLYEKMIQEEKDKETIFAREKKSRKRK